MRKIFHMNIYYLHSVPILRKAGATDEQIRILLEENPQRVLTVDAAVGTENEAVVAVEQN